MKEHDNKRTTLLIDAGNSSLKWSILKNQHLSEQQSCFYSEHTAIQQFKKLLENKASSCDHILMVSVQGTEFNQKARQIAQEHSLSFRQIKSVQSLAGVTNAYDEPHKLGTDRFVAMIAAYHLNNEQQQKACIIIDSGTATTIDAVDANGNHLGGLILPGIDLCSSSLLQNTQQLALWGKAKNQTEFKPKLFSKNTIDAIGSASIFGLSGAIQQICLNMEKAIRQEDKNISITKFLCGGSAELLLPFMDSDFHLQKDLIMLGLQVISEMAQSNTQNYE